MQLTPPVSWKLEFARSVDVERYRDIVRKAQDEAKRERKQRDDKEKDKEREERRADLEDLADVMVLATADEVETFHATIDQYDAATYEAIIANEELLVRLYQERDDMLGKAYVLPDGTRVFESEDGIRVFDEFGKELDPSVVTSEEIEDWRPKAERFQGNGSEIDAALTERASLIEYQQELDEARDRAKEGEITADELKALEQELAEEMPDAVRERLAPEHRPPMPEPDAAAPDRTPVTSQQAPIRDAPTFS